MKRTCVLRRHLMACALALTFVALVRGQEPPAMTDGKETDLKLAVSLRDVINRGREFYNNGNPAACYFMFNGSLQVTKTMLDHRPELQKVIQTGLTEADANPDMRQRAWMLRNLMDKVRNDLRGETVAGKPPEKKPVDAAKPIEPKPVEPKPIEKVDVKPAEKALWDKLGGLEAVTKVVDDFVAEASKDEKVNFDRGGKLKFTDEQVVGLKKGLVAFFSAATGGPIKYTGKSMKEVHKDMAITDAEFDASVDVLLKVMEKNGVKEDEMKAVRTAVEGTRKDIVEKKKDE